MKVSVTSKLFLAILSACVLAAVAMGVAIRTSFEYGFVDFLQEQGASDLAALQQELEAAYAQHGNWISFASTRKTGRRSMSDRRQASRRATPERPMRRTASTTMAAEVDPSPPVLPGTRGRFTRPTRSTTRT